MSFRKYGGTNFSAKNNIVNSNYNTSKNLGVYDSVGQQDSYILFNSDITTKGTVTAKTFTNGTSTLTGGTLTTNSILTDYLDVTGSINAGIITAASFNTTSDYRVKTNVRDLDDNYNVDMLRPVIYHNTLLGKNDIGFIAHEVQEQYPFMVSGEKDGEQNQGINYNSLIGVLVKEVQELKREVKHLHEEIQVLKLPERIKT